MGEEWPGGWQRREQSLPEKVAGKLSGLFVGKILGVADGMVTQRVGRACEAVVHSIADLSRTVEVGEIAEIAYQDGKGVVLNQERSQVRAVER